MSPGAAQPRFPTVVAETYEGKLFAGRNRAVLLGCVGAEGQSVTCVVKLRHRLENPNTFWIEWVAGLLADELGVQVPSRYVVVVSTELAVVLGAELGADAAACVGPNFGVEYLRHAIAVPGDDYALESELRVAAARIACFDAFVDNPDRRRENPNCLLEAGSTPRLVAIDHDLAFSGFLLPILGGPAQPHHVLAHHLFAKRFGQNKPSLDEIRDAIAGLSDAFLEGLSENVPPAWLDNASLDRTVAALKARRDSIDEWFPHVQAWMDA